MVIGSDGSLVAGDVEGMREGTEVVGEREGFAQEQQLSYSSLSFGQHRPEVNPANIQAVWFVHSAPGSESSGSLKYPSQQERIFPLSVGQHSPAYPSSRHNWFASHSTKVEGTGSVSPWWSPLMTMRAIIAPNPQVAKMNKSKKHHPQFQYLSVVMGPQESCILSLQEGRGLSSISGSAELS